VFIAFSCSVVQVYRVLYFSLSFRSVYSRDIFRVKGFSHKKTRLKSHLL